jgi:DNA-binding SARP family transcriptional activator
MQYRILGPVGVWVDEVEVRVGGPRERRALAALLLSAGHAVGMMRILDVLWGENPPRTAAAQVRNTIATLRRSLAWANGGTAPIVRAGDGFVLHLHGGQLDASTFEAAVARAGELADRGERATASEALREALALWHGPALAGLDGPIIEAAARRLEEQRQACLQRRIEIDLELGRHDELVPELAALVEQQPMRERVTELYMLALYRAGRRQDALAAFATARTRLAEHAGLDPGPALVRLQRGILRGDPELDPGRTPTTGHTAAPPPRPAQLPAGTRGFTGRIDATARLDALLAAEPAAGPQIMLISGVGGVGKTALAVHWGHRVRDRFPDGQLVVDLRGFATGPPLRPVEALSRLLRTLGLSADRIPAEPVEVAALYRSQLADRRALVLLDNAHDAEQVRPLLPGGSGCVVLITSRERLDGLVAREGAQHLRLECLDPDDSVDLMRVLVGERVEREPEAAREVAALCGYLPLALRIVAAHLAAHPERHVADLAAVLRSGDRLSTLVVDDDSATTVRGAFDLSYANLPPRVRRMFCLFGLAPRAAVTLPAAAALADEPTDGVAPLLDRLVRAHLLDAHASGRFAMHDLTHLYAAERARIELDEADSRAARVRLYEYWLGVLEAAAVILYPHSLRLTATGTDLRVTLPDAAASLSTLDDMAPGIEAAATAAVAAGLPEYSWRLADAMRGYFMFGRHPAHWAGLAGVGLAAAEAAGNRRAAAACLLSLGFEAASRNDPASFDFYQRALAASTEGGWPACEAAALGGLGLMCWRVGDLDRGIELLRGQIALNRHHGRRNPVAEGLNNLGCLLAQRGRLTEAWEHHQAALAVFRDLGMLSDQGSALNNLADVCVRLGRYEDAIGYADEALEIFRTVGRVEAQSSTLLSHVRARLGLGLPEAALRTAEEAYALVPDETDPWNASSALVGIGAAHLMLGQLDRADTAYRRALALMSAEQPSEKYIEARIGLARLRVRQRQFDAARAYAEEALVIAERGNRPLWTALALVTLATADLGQGDRDDAQRRARRAWKLAEGTGHAPVASHAKDVLEGIVVPAT